MKLVVSVNVLPNYISDLLFVGCLLQFSSLCRLFSIVHEHRLQEYCRAYQTLFKITHRHKTINKNKHNKFFIMLKRNSFKISLQI